MQDLLRLIFYGSFALAGIILLSFILWFQLRDQRPWGTLCFAAASTAMGLLAAGVFLLGPMAFALIFSALPGLIIYLWFAALWTARRQRSAILRWGARQGYHITSLERTYVLDPTGRRLHPEYRIVARRVGDGQIRVGRVLVGTSRGFDVVWDADLPRQKPRRP